MSELWPSARGLHAASCLVNPDSNNAEQTQYLLVVWGQGEDAKHVSNSWILHIQSMSWKQVCQFKTYCALHECFKNDFIVCPNAQKIF